MYLLFIAIYCFLQGVYYAWKYGRKCRENRRLKGEVVRLKESANHDYPGLYVENRQGYFRYYMHCLTTDVGRVAKKPNSRSKI